jgi:mono/diheme cytochrome c family protein
MSFSDYKIHLLIGLCLGFNFLSCYRVREPDHIPLGPEGTVSVSGVVRDEEGSVEGAVVRIQTTQFADTTDWNGAFLIRNINPEALVILTAWAPGYFIAGGEPVTPGTDSLEFILHRIDRSDNEQYDWISAFSESPGSGSCQNCHAGGPNMPFDEWLQDAHGQSVNNIRFLTMYEGTDLMGNQSPSTRYGTSRDYGNFPLPPNPDEAYYGPGYKLDFPESQGNCTACHAPMAAIDQPYSGDPLNLQGVETEGIGCDFCHKVWDVKLNPATDLPYDNMPGILSFQFCRPQEGHQFFAGPYDDVAPGEDTCTPVQRESRYCAPCHYAKFWDVTIYNSYGEWLESPYNDPESGQTCQDCHMPSGLTDHFARMDQGGRMRDPQTIFSHRMRGARDEDLLRNAVTMTASAGRDGNQIYVQVDLVNDKTGHHVPTDSPLRHMILKIEAHDASGAPLIQTGGPRLPDWCGVGDPDQGFYSGLPGKAYAKILEEAWTGVSPTGAYWNMTRLLSDNRLAAFESDHTSYSFISSSYASVTVTVTLIFRRAYKQLMEWKSWDDPDIVMSEITLYL